MPRDVLGFPTITPENWLKLSQFHLSEDPKDRTRGLEFLQELGFLVEQAPVRSICKHVLLAGVSKMPCSVIDVIVDYFSKLTPLEEFQSSSDHESEARILQSIQRTYPDEQNNWFLREIKKEGAKNAVVQAMKVSGVRCAQKLWICTVRQIARSYGEQAVRACLFQGYMYSGCMYSYQSTPLDALEFLEAMQQVAEVLHVSESVCEKGRPSCFCSRHRRSDEKQMVCESFNDVEPPTKKKRKAASPSLVAKHGLKKVRIN